MLFLLLLLTGVDRFSAVFLDQGQAILEEAPQITVMALSPEEERVPLFSFRRKAVESFHGYRILRTIVIRGETKSALLGKLYTALAEDAEPARCFNPRHGIRANSGSRSVDLLICFECRQIKSWVDRKEGGSIVGASAEEHFNKLLASTPAPAKADGHQ